MASQYIELRGWTLNSEYISEILHSLRFRPEAKLLFPHVMDVNQLDDEAIMRYKEEYAKYCLVPAIEKRQIIREQCHHLDKEYKREMPEFSI